MPANPFMAKNGLRTLGPGSLANLAIALGTDVDAPNRTGLFSGLTPGDESVDLLVGGDAILQAHIIKTLRLNSAKLNWKDFNYNPNSLPVGLGRRPDSITFASTSIGVAGFSPSFIEQVSTVVELNHEYAQGTAIYPHVHWYSTTTDVGTVRWGMEFTFTHDSVVTTSTTIYVEQITNGTAWQPYFSGFPVIAGAGRVIGDQLLFRFFRDATAGADDYPADAATGTVGFHVQVDGFGSNLISSKD